MLTCVRPLSCNEKWLSPVGGISLLIFMTSVCECLRRMINVDYGSQDLFIVVAHMMMHMDDICERAADEGCS